MPVDIEWRLVIKALREPGGISATVEAGITEEHFLVADHRKAWNWAKDYLRQHRVQPTLRRLQEEFPGYRTLLDVKEPLSDCIARVKNAKGMSVAVTAVHALGDAIENNDLTTAGEIMTMTARSLSTATTEKIEECYSESLDAHIEMLMARADYDDDEMIGLRTGFDTIDSELLGLQGGQLITLVGLAKAGKSTLEMLVGQAVQRQNKSPYYVNFEMSPKQQMSRYLAIGAHVEYSRLERGQLTEAEWQSVRNFKAEMDGRPRFRHVTDVAGHTTVSGIEAHVMRDLPDVLLIDGVYFLRDEISGEQNNSISLTNITRELKKLAVRLDIPVIISHQALPSKTRTDGKNKGHRRLDMFSTGYSHSFSQDSDLMIGIEYDEKRKKRRLLKIMASRDCDTGYDAWVLWDWRRGLFGRELERIYFEDQDDEDDDEDGDAAY
jgi:replicative DNA helicase